MTESLDAYLTRRSGWTWAQVRRAIQQERVLVQGVVCKRYHRQLLGSEVVLLDGQTILQGPDASTLICHKPRGLACSHALEDAPLIYDLVPEAWRHPNLQTAGRLDRDTTGLIIFTIDGRFHIDLTAPQRSLWKRYEIGYSGELIADAIERVANGDVTLIGENEPCKPAELHVAAADASGLGRAILTICEGRHHQVKRMIRALGGKVVELHRASIGGLQLPVELAPGQMRPLSADERTSIFNDRDIEPRSATHVRVQNYD